MAGGVEANRKLLALKELPPCDGPKLRIFEHGQSPIEWLELLEKSSPESRSASQGYVFKVRINSKIYALKVVCCVAERLPSGLLTRLHKD
jgi:hypothetical protein